MPMKKEIYESLTDKERCIYDELEGFARRLAVRMDEMTGILRAILDEANK